MGADFEDPFCVLRCAPLTAVRVHEPRVAIISFPRSVKTSEHLDLNCVNITSQGDVRTFPPPLLRAFRIAAAAIESKSKLLVSNSNWDSRPGYEQFILFLSYMSTINNYCTVEKFVFLFKKSVTRRRQGGVS